MPSAREAFCVRGLFENCGVADTCIGRLLVHTVLFENHSRHKKEVAGPIPVSICLRTAKSHIS